MSAELCLDTHFGYNWSRFYGLPEDPITINKHDLNTLLRAEIVLEALMKHGVHNFEYFDAAMKCAEEMLK